MKSGMSNRAKFHITDRCPEGAAQELEIILVVRKPVACGNYGNRPIANGSKLKERRVALVRRADGRAIDLRKVEIILNRF